ncbi:MAG: AMP-binding protein [Candidatus Competibacteraceae bacterium]|nr:AMP-binding protein [Candidatus Competibacteraceae bacterium]
MSALRFAASVGEPLNPEGVRWGQEALGQPFHDTWWQTETGAILIANRHGQELRPGSMGRPLPGITAAIVRRRPDGGKDRLHRCRREGEVGGAGWVGRLAISRLSGRCGTLPACFADGWYLSGDLATRDVEGYYWFWVRDDGAIKALDI